MRRVEAAKAYQKAARHCCLREQEADVFRRVNTSLRVAQSADGIAVSKALADNDRLWITVIDQLRDPANALAQPLRASIISVGLAVQRESAGQKPDIGFLIGINDQMALGLMGT